ncbi:centromere protein H-like [Pecten maximus]|uniref:centromere protein H-like n=1 Tax=Pecten maximus TaxID=6579 RepID=UPI0014587B29|nr:centromere protein H-like [Pecten maximus]XP_033749559.1 centromere protein H-like [Pecten maximus]XP_033749560.1 centromere protein H-like [Pecten maximus]
MDVSPVAGEGHQQPMASTPLDSPEEDHQETSTTLLAKQNWLQAQIDNHKAVMLAGSTADEDTGGKADVLADLEKKLVDAYIEKDRKELIIKRMQMGEFLIKQLFEQSTADGIDPAEKEKQTVRIKYLKELLDKQCGLVSGIMKNVKEMEPKKKRLVELKKQNFDQMGTNRHDMEALQDRQNPKVTDNQDPETQQLLEELDKSLQKITIVRNTLQAVIVGSGINWAQDPAMQELVLEMGKKLEL